MQSSINPSIYDNSPPFPYSIHNSSLISGTIDQFPTAAPTAGGPLRTSRSSGPTFTLSLSPLLADLRQEISPSNTVTSNTTAKREHTRITAQTHPVRRNTSEFDGAGDHRFPPIRPPITHDRSRPDLTESLDTALSAWCQRNPPRQWQVFEGQQASIRLQQLLDSFNTAPANTDALAQGPFPELPRSGSTFDPQSLRDPEHQVYTIDDDEQTLDDQTKWGRLLSKRETNRRLNAHSAGIERAANPSCDQQVSDRPCITAPVTPAPTRAAPLQLARQVGDRPPPQVTMTPAIVVTPSPRPWHVIQAYCETPKDLRYLDMVLDGRLTPDDLYGWVRRTISSLEGRCVLRQMGEGPDIRGCPYLLLPPPVEPGPAADHRVSTFCEQGDSTQSLMVTACARVEKQPPVRRPDLTSEEVLNEAGSAHGSATTRHRRARRNSRKQRSSFPLAPAAMTNDATLTVQMPLDPPLPDAVELEVRQVLGDSEPDRRARRRRRPKRKEKRLTRPPPPAVEGAGGVNSRGVQLKSAAEATSARKYTVHGPRQPPAPPEEASAPPASATTDHGTWTSEGAAPSVPEQSAAGPPIAPPKEAATSSAPTNHETWNAVSVGMEVSEQGTLSERREFRRKRARGRVRPTENMLVSGTSGRKGRRFFTGTYVGARPPPGTEAALHLPRLGATSMGGVGKELARMGARGLVSERCGEYDHYKQASARAVWTEEQVMVEVPAESREMPVSLDHRVISNASWAERNGRLRKGAPCPARGGRGEATDQAMEQKCNQLITGTDSDRKSEMRTAAHWLGSAKEVTKDGTEEGSRPRTEKGGRAELVGTPGISETEQEPARRTELVLGSWKRGESARPGYGTGVDSAEARVAAETLAGSQTVPSSLGGGDVWKASRAQRNNRHGNEASGLACCGREDTTVPVVDWPGSAEGGFNDGTDAHRRIRVGESSIETRTETVAASVMSWVKRGALQQRVNIMLSDWENMEALGMGTFPDLVVGFALRRCTGSGQLRTILVVGQDGTDLPRGAWPASWSDLVEHVRIGGFFRTTAVLRGGMEPAEAQQLLDATRFTESLKWDEIDQFLAQVRSGTPIQPPPLPPQSPPTQLPPPPISSSPQVGEGEAMGMEPAAIGPDKDNPGEGRH